MGYSIHKCLTVGVAAITASAIVFAPSITPAPPPRPAPSQIVHVESPAITLTAGVQPLAAASVTDILGFVEHYVVPPSAGQPFPTPQFPPVVAPTSIGSSLIWIYNAVEPWVRYGFDLAAYAVGWVPYVGWLAPQITIFYNFGERIAQSITYNIAYWLDGNISFGQGLANVGADTVDAFIQLGIDQWNFWLWPLPPLPPIFPGCAGSDDRRTDHDRGRHRERSVGHAKAQEEGRRSRRQGNRSGTGTSGRRGQEAEGAEGDRVVIGRRFGSGRASRRAEREEDDGNFEPRKRKEEGRHRIDG